MECENTSEIGFHLFKYLMVAAFTNIESRVLLLFIILFCSIRNLQPHWFEYVQFISTYYFTSS